MKKIFFTLLVLGFVSSIPLGAQTIPLSDFKFKSCLSNNYEDLLDNSNELIIADANEFSETLDCESYDIEDLSDLQYFKSIRELVLIDNDVVDLSPLRELTNLETIDLSFNNIQDTLDVEGLTGLKSLILHNNDIKGIKNLETLINLENLDVHTNDLALLPDLDQLTILKTIDFSDNRFQDLPLLYLPELEQVKAGDNKLTFEDFLLFTELDDFDTVFPDLNVQAIQAKVLTDTIMENQLWDWHLSFDKEVTTNVYKWFKDGEFHSTTTIAELEIEKVALADSGEYTCEITNTNLKLADFKIKTTIRTLVIIPDTTTIIPVDTSDTDTTVVEKECFELVDFMLDIDTPRCEEIAHITFNVSISGDTEGALNYYVNGELLENPEFDALTEGSYSVILSDDNCRTDATSFEVVFDNLNCDSDSFSPNGDGVEDTFHIETIGLTKIYSKSGELVKILETPAVWDGTDENNVLQNMGLYIIITDNNQSTSVTLLR